MIPNPHQQCSCSKVIIGTLLLLGAAQSTQACTGISLMATDGTAVRARTLDFAVGSEYDVIVVPRGYARIASAPNGKDGLKWKTKYASVGVNAYGLPLMADGLNEQGLAAGMFYFPTAVGYMPYTDADLSKTLAPFELVSWLLDSFATTDEVKANIGKVVVPAVVSSQLGIVPPLHFLVNDASGKSIVLEYVGGKLNVHDNPLGVITNSPTFDWQMTNLRNYINISPTNAMPLQLGSVKLEPFGQGSGMIGLPGDFTPPSRFVRAAIFSQSVLPSKTGVDAVVNAFRILDNVTIPIGLEHENTQGEHSGGVQQNEHTLWTGALDLKAKRYYFRTYENSQIRSVDLMKMNLDAKDVVTFSMKGDESIKLLNP